MGFASSCGESRKQALWCRLQPLCYLGMKGAAHAIALKVQARMEATFCAPLAAGAVAAARALLGRVAPEAVHRVLLQARVLAVKVVLRAPAHTGRAPGSGVTSKITIDIDRGSQQTTLREVGIRHHRRHA